MLLFVILFCFYIAFEMKKMSIPAYFSMHSIRVSLRCDIIVLKMQFLFVF